jgi:hypothetical protein
MHESPNLVIVLLTMGNHHDAEITEIVVVLNKDCEGELNGMVEKLKAVGMDVFSTDEQNNVIEGAIDSSKLSEVQKTKGVNFVRSILTYVADYPPGDPRDKDGVEDDE